MFFDYFFIPKRITVFKPYYCNNGYMQVVDEPPKYFGLKMNSGRIGIMKCLKVRVFRDFGVSCYGVKFRFTGHYCKD